MNFKEAIGVRKGHQIKTLVELPHRYPQLAVPAGSIGIVVNVHTPPRLRGQILFSAKWDVRGREIHSEVIAMHASIWTER